jgi:hypothetical protein
MGYLGAFRRPAVSTTEKSTLMYLLPPPWAVGTIDVAWIVFWLNTFAVSVYTLRQPIPLDADNLHAWRVFIAGLLVCLSMWGITKYIVSLTNAWWHENYWRVIGANMLLGVATFGTLYIYWNIKETITPFELTGFDRVLWQILKPAIKSDISNLGSKTLEELKHENEELKAKVNDNNSSPLVRTNTYAGRLTIAELEWTLGVTQFLFIGAATENGFSRSKWVSVKLPSGLIITDALWRYLCGEGGELKRMSNDVLVKSGRKTTLNSSYSPIELVAMVQQVRLPGKMRPKE